jgi:hypothetical protein
MRLLAGALDQFDGKLEMLFKPTGFICTIELKITEAHQALSHNNEETEAFSK